MSKVAARQERDDENGADNLEHRRNLEPQRRRRELAADEIRAQEQALQAPRLAAVERRRNFDRQQLHQRNPGGGDHEDGCRAARPRELTEEQRRERKRDRPEDVDVPRGVAEEPHAQDPAQVVHAVVDHRKPAEGDGQREPQQGNRGATDGRRKPITSDGRPRERPPIDGREGRKRQQHADLPDEKREHEEERAPPQARRTIAPEARHVEEQTDRRQAQKRHVGHVGEREHEEDRIQRDGARGEQADADADCEFAEREVDCPAAENREHDGREPKRAERESGHAREKRTPENLNDGVARRTDEHEEVPGLQQSLDAPGVRPVVHDRHVNAPVYRKPAKRENSRNRGQCEPVLRRRSRGILV